MEPIRTEDIRELNREALEEFLVSRGLEKYRARQVYEWLWKRGATDFGQMTSLPIQVRDLLSHSFTLRYALKEIVQQSTDGTRKIGFRLFDGLLTEGVLIPSGSRATACISSQAGCPLGCRFCATGFLGYHRNLTAGEIFDQVMVLRELAAGKESRSLSNIVLMGMGEPLLNYSNVMKALEHVCSPAGLGISPQRITLSTVGIVEMIRRLGDDRVKFNLALSLHTASDLKRDSIIPVNRSNPLDAISSALRYFYEKTSSRITFEYILMKDFNDGLTDARDLAAYCRMVPCKINLIEYNPVPGSRFEKPDAGRVKQFKEFLESKNLVVNIRKSRGRDIDAACGQLANRTSKK